MQKIVNDIINDLTKSNEEKQDLLNQLEEDIEIGKRIIKGEFKKCRKCKEYFLTKSFLSDTEQINGKVCIYQDPINSGGNDYADGIIKIFYEICPRGHKYEIDRTETTL